MGGSRLASTVFLVSLLLSSGAWQRSRCVCVVSWFRFVFILSGFSHFVSLSWFLFLASVSCILFLLYASRVMVPASYVVTFACCVVFLLFLLACFVSWLFVFLVLDCCGWSVALFFFWMVADVIYNVHHVMICCQTMFRSLSQCLQLCADLCCWFVRSTAQGSKQ